MKTEIKVKRHTKMSNLSGSRFGYGCKTRKHQEMEAQRQSKRVYDPVSPTRGIETALLLAQRPTPHHAEKESKKNRKQIVKGLDTRTGA